MIDYSGMCPELRRRLGGPGIRAFEAAADEWLLTREQRMLFLRTPNRNSYEFWKWKAREQAELKLDLDTLLRVSAFLAVHEELLLAFRSKRDARRWLRRRHHHKIFSGHRPIDVILATDRQHLLRIDDYLRKLKRKKVATYMPSWVNPIAHLAYAAE